MGVSICLIFMLFFMYGCNSKDNINLKRIDFKQIQWYANRASFAYNTPTEIQKTYPDTVRVASVNGTDVQYFIENPVSASSQVISIRGTANLANVREDAEYLPSKNHKLGIYVHKGFDEDTLLVYRDLLPHLDKNKKVILTGHSLGAAISTLLMMYLHEDGFTIELSINFGQPKVTNRKGAGKYAFLPLLRVADENDVVPLLPPTTLLDAIHGTYQHIGSEIILLEGLFYVFQDEHLQRQTSSDSFWKNLGHESIDEHFMKHYLHNINSKLDSSKEVPFEQREKYIDK